MKNSNSKKESTAAKTKPKETLEPEEIKTAEPETEEEAPDEEAAPAAALSGEAAFAAKMNLQQKMVEIRKEIPFIVRSQASEVKYKFAKIFDVYKLLAPALNRWRVNFDIMEETASTHAENGDGVYHFQYVQSTKYGEKSIWCYECDLVIRWTNADNPEDYSEAKLHAIGTNDLSPDKAKGAAWTYCLKYYLYEKFNIDQGEEDPDQAGGKDNRNEQGAQRRLSDIQVKTIFEKARAAGLSEGQCRITVQNYYKTKVELLTASQYDDLCRQLSKAAAKKKEQAAVFEGAADENTGG